MSKFQLATYPKKFTREEIRTAKSANTREAATNAAAEQKKRMAALKTDLNQYIITFLDEWVNQANLAITRASPPPDKRSHRSWFLALMGNLVWAGTAFITAQPLIVILSFAGATVGSGTIPEFEGTPSAPQDPKELVTQRIHDNYPKVSDYFVGESDKWAWELDAHAQAGYASMAARMDEYVWNKMFERIPYATRHGTIYTQIKANMESMLADYHQQWRAWLAKNGLESMSSDATWFKAVMYQMDPFRPNLDKHWAKFSQASR